ncbi:exosortase/archaeosortase family protein [Adhaeretor mobilis]|uniref:Transmembrane exosortase n=1 Tax=Adhaeretor mobilis TaxID=1930276 RepID=A0A517N352_9BACT|nr:exosortase/archaeosortase family protein [Adhaeretor mobilis]QDT01418.1 Transmembrane exosortase [Adhaeretor mobilis]
MSSTFDNDFIDEDIQLDADAEQKAWIIFGVLFALVTLAYENLIRATVPFWFDSLYSHGWLIPVIAAGLFWVRRQPLTRVATSERWIGAAVMFLFLNLRWYFSIIDMQPVIRMTFIGVLLGVVMLVGGWRMLKWAGPAVAFLLFMFPLPSVLEHTVLLGLQKMATICSTAVLQTLGISAVRDGNRILIGEMQLGVVDACSGLRMLTIFVAMSVALAIVMKRPWWDRLAVLVAAVPIALLANIIRIVITALLYKWFGMENDLINTLVHDWAGLAMMPIGLGFLALLFAILSNLTIPIEDDYSDFGMAAG